MKSALSRSTRPSRVTNPFLSTSFADPAFQLLSFHIVAKSIDGPPPSALPLAASSPLFFFTLFRISPIIATLTKKHPGYRGSYLRTPAWKSRDPQRIPILAHTNRRAVTLRPCLPASIRRGTTPPVTSLPRAGRTPEEGHHSLVTGHRFT